MEIKDIKKLTNVFNIIHNFKHIPNEEYYISKDDMFFLYKYYILYNINKYMTLKQFKTVIVEFSVFNNTPFLKTCEEFCKKIKI